jgi:hypothetical protein
MAGRYDKINGAYSKTTKRYDKIGGVWTPTKKRHDKVGGAWTQSYASAICSAAFESTNIGGYGTINFTNGSFNHDTGEIVANFSPSGSWQQAIIRITFDEDQQITASDTLLSITAQFSAGVQQWCINLYGLNTAGNETFGTAQFSARKSGDTITIPGSNETFRAIEIVLSFEGAVAQAIIPAGGLLIANKLITGFHD